MECPDCGYIMDAFTVACPRCTGEKKAPSPASPAPADTAVKTAAVHCQRCGMILPSQTSLCPSCDRPATAQMPAPSAPPPLPGHPQPAPSSPPPLPTVPAQPVAASPQPSQRPVTPPAVPRPSPSAAPTTEIGQYDFSALMARLFLPVVKVQELANEDYRDANRERAKVTGYFYLGVYALSLALMLFTLFLAAVIANRGIPFFGLVSGGTVSHLIVGTVLKLIFVTGAIIGGVYLAITLLRSQHALSGDTPGDLRVTGHILEPLVPFQIALGGMALFLSILTMLVMKIGSYEGVKVVVFVSGIMSLLLFFTFLNGVSEMTLRGYRALTDLLKASEPVSRAGSRLAVACVLSAAVLIYLCIDWVIGKL